MPPCNANIYIELKKGKRLKTSPHKGYDSSNNSSSNSSTEPASLKLFECRIEPVFLPYFDFISKTDIAMRVLLFNFGIQSQSYLSLIFSRDQIVINTKISRCLERNKCSNDKSITISIKKIWISRYLFIHCQNSTPWHYFKRFQIWHFTWNVRLQWVSVYVYISVNEYASF